MVAVAVEVLLEGLVHVSTMPSTTDTSSRPRHQVRGDVAAGGEEVGEQEQVAEHPKVTGFTTAAPQRQNEAPLRA
jgi:hypothetical protein